MNHSRRVHVNLYNSALVSHYYNTNSSQYIIVILNSNTRGLLRINSDPDLISYPYANPAICSQITLRLSFTPLLITHPCLVCMSVFRILQPNLILRVGHFNLLWRQRG